MGFYFRKSKNLGFGKLNFSNSGIGFSTGIKGLRFGIDSKGRTYISGGKGAFRFREYLSTSSKKKYTESQTHKEYKTVVNDDYKPNIFNSWSAKGFKGIINMFLKTLACTILSLIAFIVFGMIVVAIGEKHPGIALLIFFIFGIGTMIAPWQHIFKPKFIKYAQDGYNQFIKQDYEQAQILLEQARNIEKESKYCCANYNFDKWLNDLLYDCYTNLNDDIAIVELLENTYIISDRDERLLNAYEKTEQHDKMLKFIEESSIAGKREKKCKYCINWSVGQILSVYCKKNIHRKKKKNTHLFMEYWQKPF